MTLTVDGKPVTPRPSEPIPFCTLRDPLDGLTVTERGPEAWAEFHGLHVQDFADTQQDPPMEIV